MNFISKHRYILILIGLFLLQFFLISPVGEFPLNDDWVHTEMIKHWVDTGAFRMNPYTGPLLFFPIMYGAALAKIFDFSFSLLRISTLIITFLLTSGIFLFLHKKTNNAALSFLAALTIWLNPIVYNLSFTFMTDVPALLLLFISIIYFVKAQETNNWKYFFCGALAAILGFYTRQTNILILAAFGLYVLFNKELRSAKNIIALGIPAFIGIIIYWFLHTHQLLPDGGALHNIPGKRAMIEHAFFWFWYTLLYLGLFTLPITISLLKNNWRNKKYWLAACIGLLLPLVLFWWRGELFPYVPNMINQFGLGPLSDVLQGNFVPLFRTRVWFAVSLAAGLGTGLLARSLWLAKNIRGQGWLWLFCGLFVIPILFLSSFDRYFMPLFLVLVIILANLFKDTKIGWSSWVILGIVAMYSVTQTHFYLQWNGVRVDLINQALSVKKIPQNKIDAGYEWTGYLGYWESRNQNVGRGPENSPWWIKFLMTNNTVDYIVSVSPLPGYQVWVDQRVVGYNSNHRLYLLRRSK